MNVPLTYAPKTVNAKMSKYEMMYKLSKNGNCPHGIQIQEKKGLMGGLKSTGNTCDICESEFAQARVVTYEAEAELEEKKEMELPVNSIKDTKSIATEYFNKLEITSQEAKKKLAEANEEIARLKKDITDYSRRAY